MAAGSSTSSGALQASASATVAISAEQVTHIAKLARLTLLPQEIPLIAAQLEKILAHIADLAQADTEGIAPTAQVGVDRMPLRDDVVTAGIEHTRALAEAPEAAGGGFVVPAFVDE